MLRNKEDEFAANRKKMIIDIETLQVWILIFYIGDLVTIFWLQARLHETEAKLKNEVEKIKKKMAVTITELEMSLDAANKSNVQLTNASKVCLYFCLPLPNT